MSRGHVFRAPLAAAAAGVVALAGLTACAQNTEITVDGLPVTNAESYIHQVDGLWHSHLRSGPALPTTAEDSACYFLMYDNVALNSIVCGPVHWLGDEETTWDYYPLETVLSTDGRSLEAVARGRFMGDYPMSEADDLFRPDNARPNLDATLAEPAAPVTDESVLYVDGLPEERRITASFQFPGDSYLAMDPVGELAADGSSGGVPDDDEVRSFWLTRAVWSSHVGQGADVVAAPEGSQFLTLTSSGHVMPSYPVITGVEPMAPVSATTHFVIDGAHIPATEWDGRGSWVVPDGEPSEARLVTTLRGAPVSIDLLTGEADPQTRLIFEGYHASEVSPAFGTSGRVDGRYRPDASLSGIPVTSSGEEQHTAILSPYLPQLGLPPAGELWLVAGVNVDFSLTDTEEDLPVNTGDITLTASLVGSGRMVRLVELSPPSGSTSRQAIAVTTVPQDTVSAQLTITGKLSGWTVTHEEHGTLTIPDATVPVTADLSFE